MKITHFTNSTKFEIQKVPIIDTNKHNVCQMVPDNIKSLFNNEMILWRKDIHETFHVKLISSYHLLS